MANWIIKFTIIALVVPGLNCQLDNQKFLHDECVKAKCQYPSLCYIPHPTNCFKFIMCKPLESGSIIVQDMPCAFGTKWKAGLDPSCDRYDLVDCINDLCRTNITAHDHLDGNCRTYWSCVNGRSEPSCCERFHSFNPTTKVCEPDTTCDGACPILNDATCRGLGVSKTFFPDGNCRTHWDCENGHPHPVCCPEGQGFDILNSMCIADASCTDTCPKEYSESCSRPGTVSYDLVDANCRTYMKCNKDGTADPFCCLSGMMYDSAGRSCVEAKGLDCVNVGCPYGYREECRLEAVPGRKDVYKNLDAFGGLIMPCPVGTAFDPAGCQCSPVALLTSLAPVGCTVAIDAQLPNLKNLGTAVAALLMIGKYGQGEKGVGNMTAFWDGAAGINIPFYGSQAPYTLYLEARVRPTAGSNARQVLASSCHYINGIPTLELSLSQFTDVGGVIQLVMANEQTAPVQINAPYKFNDEIVIRVIYDGKHVGFFVDNVRDPTQSVSNVSLFSGPVQIDRAGLRFAHCRYENDVASFIGYVSQIKFSKCLTQEMTDTLNTASGSSALPV